MAQQNIDFGTFPDDPDADAIRTAFSKVQNNFDELFSTVTAGSVTSVNGGAGIAVNAPTGNVIVTANLAQVVVSTSSLRGVVGLQRRELHQPANAAVAARRLQVSPSL